MEDYKAKQAARDAAAKAVQAAYPYLVPVQSVKGGALIAAAKNIRIELARAFPEIKFSIKSRRFSGGDAIDVSWMDGPNGDQVDEILDKYSAGSFDGSEDIYRYSRDAYKDAFGDAKYIHSARQNSDKAIESALRSVLSRYDFAGEASVEAFRAGKLWNVYPVNGGGNYGLQDLIYQVMSKRVWALSKAPKAAELEEAAS